NRLGGNNFGQRNALSSPVWKVYCGRGGGRNTAWRRQVEPQPQRSAARISHPKLAPGRTEDRISARELQWSFNLQAAFHLGRKRIIDRKSTRLNSSHVAISYAVFCLKKKKHYKDTNRPLQMYSHRPSPTRHLPSSGSPR